jgi:hypothetical protein
LFVGAIPAADVTADFFEIANRDGGIGIAIGDAPSTGLRSAFVARFLGNLFQRLWQVQKPPVELGPLLERINSIIVPHPEFERISMQCVELGPLSRAQRHVYWTRPSRTELQNRVANSAQQLTL